MGFSQIKNPQNLEISNSPPNSYFLFILYNNLQGDEINGKVHNYSQIAPIFPVFYLFAQLLCYYYLHTYYTNSGGTGTRNPIFGCLESTEKWVEDKSLKLFRLFLIFCQKNCHI